jgi:hypothetical protein
VDDLSLVTDTFAGLGLQVSAALSDTDGSTDFTLEPDGIGLPVQIKRRALVDEGEAQRLLNQPRMPHGLLLVVGDRVTAGARALLVDNRAGYLDLRGHLAVRTDRLVIDTDVEPHTSRPSRSQALSGTAGIEVAVALLLSPTRPGTVRALARSLSRSPSTVSEVLALLRADNLVSAENTVGGPDLFWALADRWPSQRTGLTQAPDLKDATLAGPLRLGLDDIEHTAGWALTGTAAAQALGAPVATQAEQVLDFYVPDRAALRRAITLLSAPASPSLTRATVRVAPVPAAVTGRRHIPAPRRAAWAGWPITQPVFVALDLAQDHGRGRQILDEWTPDGGVRVW